MKKTGPSSWSGAAMRSNDPRWHYYSNHIPYEVRMIGSDEESDDDDDDDDEDNDEDDDKDEDVVKKQIACVNKVAEKNIADLKEQFMKDTAAIKKKAEKNIAGIKKRAEKNDADAKKNVADAKKKAEKKVDDEKKKAERNVKKNFAALPLTSATVGGSYEGLRKRKAANADPNEKNVKVKKEVKEKMEKKNQYEEGGEIGFSSVYYLKGIDKMLDKEFTKKWRDEWNYGEDDHDRIEIMERHVKKGFHIVKDIEDDIVYGRTFNPYDDETREANRGRYPCYRKIQEKS
jgi:hypothetical protein